MPPSSQPQLIIDTIRTLAMDAVQKARSGHPGTPMALAPLAYLLWDRILRYNPKNPDWPDRDRFVLSAGHASMLLYGILHLSGYDLSLDDIKQFRQLHSKTPGHPEYGLTPGAEATTGPLGQGTGISVGMAIAERWLAARFNRPGHRIVGHRVFAVCSDGDFMEGISGEAASLAGHLGLDNLVWLYDNNRITIEGSTDLAYSDDVEKRFLGYRWNVHRVEDINDLDLLEKTVREAMKETARPSLIIVDSHIAWGSPNKQDTADAHGAPLGEEEIRLTKKRYGWDPDKQFHIPEEVRGWTADCQQKGDRAEKEWRQRFEAYGKEFPDLAAEFVLIQKRGLPEGWDADLPVAPADEKGMASRKASGNALNAIAPKIPWLLGGSADLAPSTNTIIKTAEHFQKDRYQGRNLHFGIREHAMGAICNGMSLSRLRPYGATFLIFSDYCRPAIRLAALMELPVIYVFTHDSIGLGEDGPTHQPVEHLTSLRAIPNLDVIRPADANETAWAWVQALRSTDHPVLLVLTRQNLPTLDRAKYAPAEGTLRGGYILADCSGPPELILIGTGSEIQHCVGAHEKLTAEGVRCRVVSMPSTTIFDRQDAAYRDRVLPPAVIARVAVEAGSRLSWSPYVGIDGAILGVEKFGASAPIKDVMREYGFTADRVLEAA
ncbi:MAG: transketolase, partial [Acidobacteriota bacterium]